MRGCFPGRLEQGGCSGQRSVNTQLQGCWEGKELSGNFKLFATLSGNAAKKRAHSGVRGIRTLICQGVNVDKDITAQLTSSSVIQG